MKNASIIVLALSLVGQVAWIAHATISAPRAVPVESGAPLPFALESWVRDAVDSQASESGCHVGYLCSPSCPFCGRLAERFHDVEPSTEAWAPVVWLLAASSDTLASLWGLEHGLDPRAVVRLRPVQRSPLQRPVYGRIQFTPTRVVFRSDGTVVDVRPSDEFLSTARLRRICSGGPMEPSPPLPPIDAPGPK